MAEEGGSSSTGAGGGAGAAQPAARKVTLVGKTKRVLELFRDRILAAQSRDERLAVSNAVRQFVHRQADVLQNDYSVETVSPPRDRASPKT